MDKKGIIITVLVLALVVLAIFTYYIYSGAMKCKAVATDLGTTLQQCGTGLNQCMAGAKTLQDALTALGEVPACAPYLPTQ
jgi:hypothetical protein